ncbi:2-methoxy-6-polyprenyl-1,4-benzoquinol methylase, mitochondrial-like [Python bivittatus]|uniref:2-methoxy-6-polyprenyl-1,4-benzoquinol methylase, mitochondrial n=1 Tax=Python bivittatus TaxID=176946 RepID=A0A9F5IR14_PYTBI|nr:2-methoxy-6-polyprenyl-1,4-benzoquinol methylase, mitochondrial-like [Python bivittatus]
MRIWVKKSHILTGFEKENSNLTQIPSIQPCHLVGPWSWAFSVSAPARWKSTPSPRSTPSLLCLSSVYQLFENAAKKYDEMNDSMTLGIHRIWRDILLCHMNPYPGAQLIDVAGGTGDIAFRFLNYVRSQREHQIQQKLRSHQNLSWQEITHLYQEEENGSLGGSHVVVCDINKEMVKVGKQKSQQLGYSEGLSWVVGNAEDLPFQDDKFDIYTIAFGIRNVTHMDQVLQEAYRVLKPGGRFLCLEFSQVNNSLLSRLKTYQYLVESIRRFPAQEEFKEMIEDAGFVKVEYQNLTLGIVAIHSGFKL